MSGTAAGAAKSKKTLLAKNPNYFKEIGTLGGSVKGVRKGFAIDDRKWHEKLFRKPSRAQQAGVIGGTISRRGPNPK